MQYRIEIVDKINSKFTGVYLSKFKDDYSVMGTVNITESNFTLVSARHLIKIDKLLQKPSYIESVVYKIIPIQG